MMSSRVSHIAYLASILIACHAMPCHAMPCHTMMMMIVLRLCDLPRLCCRA